MSNGYNHHFHHQNLHHHHHHHKSTFLPMLCSRPSIKDVHLPKWEDRSMSFSNDPLSPKIGCMGQVKRNNRIVGLPTLNKLSISSSASTKSDFQTPNLKYSKLKRMFSGRNLASSTSTSSSIATSTCHRRRTQAFWNGASRPRIDDSKHNASASINLDEMDPPLPVIKKVQKPADGGEANSLWKRRSGGVALANLQLQQIQLNRHHHEPTTF